MAASSSVQNPHWIDAAEYLTDHVSMRIDISEQEAIYIAMGFRALARQSREDAEKQDTLVVKEVHRDAAETYERFAEKYDRLNKKG